MLENQQKQINLPCPKCKLRTATHICFGKKAHCFNCSHEWILRWRGARKFDNAGELV